MVLRPAAPASTGSLAERKNVSSPQTYWTRICIFTKSKMILVYILVREVPKTYHSQCSGCWYSWAACWNGIALVEFSSKQWKLSLKFKLNYTIQNVYQNDIIHEKLCAPTHVHMGMEEGCCFMEDTLVISGFSATMYVKLMFTRSAPLQTQTIRPSRSFSDLPRASRAAKILGSYRGRQIGKKYIRSQSIEKETTFDVKTSSKANSSI